MYQSQRGPPQLNQVLPRLDQTHLTPFTHYHSGQEFTLIPLYIIFRLITTLRFARCNLDSLFYAVMGHSQSLFFYFHKLLSNLIIYPFYSVLSSNIITLAELV
jgi:hypothetical protein